MMQSWIRVDAFGNSEIIEVDKITMMRRCDLPARDLRLLDPLLDYPSTILCRENAIVVNLEQIRCIITADEVLILKSLYGDVLNYVEELQRRLTTAGVGEVRQSEGDDLSRRRGSRSFDNVPFEFRALEVALETVCTFLKSEVTELESKAYPLLDELTSKISTSNLERVRRVKSRLVALTRRVQKVRDEIEQLMDDDGDMAEMYLTEKKKRMESSSPPPDSLKVEKSMSIARSRRHKSMRSSEELEMLLEAHFVQIDRILNKLITLKEYIDDSEDYINMQLGNVRNKLIQFDLLLSSGAFINSIFGVVAGIFGMNLPIALYHDPSAFKWVLIISGVFGIIIFSSFVLVFKHRRLMTLKMEVKKY